MCMCVGGRESGTRGTWDTGSLLMRDDGDLE